MKAIILKEAGPVENLIHTEVAMPTPQAGEVLVKVNAISVNPVDVKARANDGVLTWIYNTQRPVILGWDISGEVVAVGEGVDTFQVNNDVFGMVNFIGDGQAYAEYVAVPAKQLALKPTNISHEEAAASTLAALTAWQALIKTANIQKGQKVLVHAGSGGVGHFAIQIAKHTGAYVIATSSSKNKAFILSLGADEHVDYQEQNLSQTRSEIDVVLDTLGGDVLHESVGMVKESGKIITLPSSDIDQATLDLAAAANIDISFILVESNGQDMKSIATLLEQRHLKAHVSATYDFAEMDKAHLHLETGRTVGKVVVTI